MEGLHAGDRSALLRQIPDRSVSAVLTDARDQTVGTWAEIARVMLPGAHAIVFGAWGVGLALRRVGFEMRDSLLHPHGSRAVNSVAFLVRRPYIAPTVTAQVIATGTGALNIGGTRIRHSSAADFEKHKAGVEAIKARGGSMANSWKNSSDLSGANDVTLAGRWPSNALLAHSPRCVRSVETGEETSWTCGLDCPVAILDEQSGVTRSGAMRREVEAYEGTSNTPFLRGRSGPSNQHGDAGGASRFFRTFSTAVAGEMPIEALGYLVRMICPSGGLVLDPFCGLGDVCVAARLGGHRFLGLVERGSYEAAASRLRERVGSCSTST